MVQRDCAAEPQPRTLQLSARIAECFQEQPPLDDVQRADAANGRAVRLQRSDMGQLTNIAYNCRRPLTAA
ncbi:hypothetical protein IP86_02530 [Rhodopseudomonas sp. AAP120]|nr:hypothetical protein IP86_02530 [Rhodopseudomonas sp. AAP120]